MWKKFLLWLGKAIVQAPAAEAAKKLPGSAPDVPPGAVRDVLTAPPPQDGPRP